MGAQPAFDYTFSPANPVRGESLDSCQCAMKILVVDDHPLIRAALRYALADLQDEVELLDASNCESALRIAAAHDDLDIVLLDLELPDVQGLGALARVREQCPSTPVVVISASEQHDIVLATLDHGAMGFIPKSSPTEVMLSALRLVLSGGVYVPPQALPGPSDIHHRPRTDGLRPGQIRKPADIGLTDRQAEVLALMVQGMSNKLICRELNLAEGTVKIHVTAILKALNVANRTQAVIEVGRLGLVLTPPGKEGYPR